MRHLTLLLLLLTCTRVSFAGVQVQSYYFKANSTELISGSEQQLKEFISSLDGTGLQLLELSCYAEGSTPDSNKRMSDLRMSRIIDLLGLKNKPITINSWGSQRLSVKFKPLNWDRIDIYYGENQPSDSVRSASYSPIINYAQKSSKKQPLVLHILFEGGTSVMIEETIHFLDKLYDTLQKNPQLTAHIRGHVCCENNKRLSRIRAKEVHDYLVEKGISQDRLSFKGYGNKLPLVYPELNPSDRSQNRRVDVVFSLKEN